MLFSAPRRAKGEFVQSLRQTSQRPIHILTALIVLFAAALAMSQAHPAATPRTQIWRFNRMRINKIYFFKGAILKARMAPPHCRRQRFS